MLSTSVVSVSYFTGLMVGRNRKYVLQLVLDRPPLSSAADIILDSAVCCSSVALDVQMISDFFNLLVVSQPQVVPTINTLFDYLLSCFAQAPHNTLSKTVFTAIATNKAKHKFLSSNRYLLNSSSSSSSRDSSSSISSSSSTGRDTQTPLKQTQKSREEQQQQQQPQDHRLMARLELVWILER